MKTIAYYGVALLKRAADAFFITEENQPSADTEPPPSVSVTVEEDLDVAWLRELGVIAEEQPPARRSWLDERPAPDDASWVRAAVQRNERAEERRAATRSWLIEPPARAHRPTERSPLLVAVRRRTVSNVSRSEVRNTSNRSVQYRTDTSEGGSATSSARSAAFGNTAESAKKAQNRAELAEEVNVRELQLVTKALTLRAKGATKQEAIEAVWGCTKGGGKVWRRASALFDAALATAEA